MPSRSIVSKLPTSVRSQLDRKLRDAAYGDYVALSEWLTGLGFAISKSALHSHGVTLRKADAANQDVRAQVALARRHLATPEAMSCVELIDGLRQLRIREHAVLEQLFVLLEQAKG